MTVNRGALSDIRVVELGQLIARPFCGQLLGDIGADVIKVEPPAQAGKRSGDRVVAEDRGVRRRRRGVVVAIRIAGLG